MAVNRFNTPPNREAVPSFDWHEDSRRSNEVAATGHEANELLVASREQNGRVWTGLRPWAEMPSWPSATKLKPKTSRAANHLSLAPTAMRLICYCTRSAHLHLATVAAGHAPGRTGRWRDRSQESGHMVRRPRLWPAKTRDPLDETLRQGSRRLGETSPAPDHPSRFPRRTRMQK